MATANRTRLDPIDQWGQWMRAESATDKTIETRLYGLRSLCQHAGDPGLPADPLTLTELDIVAWLADQTSGWTRRTYATSARQWHRWLLERGLRVDDPTAKLKMPPLPRNRPRPAATVALDQVLRGATDWTRAYVLLAAYQGLRCCEIARVRGDDFEDGSLFVEGKGGILDAIPTHPAVEDLRRLFPSTGWWFPSDSKYGHVWPNSVSKRVAVAFDRAGYAATTAHQLRHWFGTHTLRASRDLRTTQELMRHRSVTSTQIYTEVSAHDKRAAVLQLTTRTDQVAS